MPLLVSLVAPFLIWAVLWLVGGPDSVLDPLLLNALYAGDHPALVTYARVLTRLGSWTFLLPALGVAAIFLVAKRRARSAAALVAIVLLGRFAVDLQKFAIARLRPDLHEQLVSVISSSYPSGHSANSAITYVAIAIILSGRPVWIGLAGTLAMAIGISRVMLGVHWPSDVVGGWSFALFWLVGSLWLAKALDAPEHQ